MKKGFTLAELLIVVTIIAVLVAVAVPIFGKQLEKSREAVDISNVRGAVTALTEQHIADANNNHFLTVSARQTQSGWQGAPGTVAVMMKDSISEFPFDAKTASDGSYTVIFTSTGSVTVE